MNTIARSLLYALPAALLLAVPSCIVVPTPGLRSQSVRHNIGPDTAARFQPGRTTRAQVLLVLGEPDAVSPDERRLAYRTVVVPAVWLAGGGYTGVAGAIEKNEFLVLRFDAGGRLLDCGSSSSWITPGEPAQKLGAAGGERTAGARLQARADWLSGTDDYRARGIAGAEWLPGELVLTDHELRFFVRADFANAPPKLRLPYRDVAAVGEDRIFAGRFLAVETRDGRRLGFLVRGKSKWSTDPQSLQEVLAFLRSKVPAHR